MVRNRVLFYISVIFLSSTLLSLRWPVDNGRITSTFGESRWDHFHDGIDIVSRDERIYPVDQGELLFYWDKSVFPLDNYSGGGNYKILKHNENYSIYMHLDDGLTTKEKYNIDDPIGMMGNTGHSFSKHLHFSILNYKEKSSYNPLVMLPKYDDEKQPLVANIMIKLADKNVILKDKASVRLTQYYPLLMEIYDNARGAEKLGIYKISVSVNGKVQLDTDFKSIKFDKNGLTVNGRNYAYIYDEKGYYKVENPNYIDGENIIVITATDFAGNKTEKKYQITVKLEAQKI